MGTLQTLTGEDERGDGTARSGYATPEFGPFECANCVHFTAPSSCDHPRVIRDPEVRGRVEAEGCCNFFRSAHRETQDEESAEPHEARPRGSAA